MKKRLVLAGGGHAHMVLLAHMQELTGKGYHVTVINPSEHHYYSGMGPGMLGGSYAPQQIRFATQHVTEKMGGSFIRAKVVRIAPEAQQVICDNGETVPYDVLSCNLGSQVPVGIVNGPLDDVFLVKPIERLFEARERILERGKQQSLGVAVVGGGPSAVEIAGNVWRLGEEEGMQGVEVSIFTGNRLMPDHPDGVRKRCAKSLQARGIEVIEGCRINHIETGLVRDAENQSYGFDIIFVAIGVRPSQVFSDSGIVTGDDGGMLVNRFLQSPAYPNIFGGGDCVSFADQPLDKVGVYAVRQNPVLLHNVTAALEGGDFQPFEPGGEYLLIFNLGDNTGVLYKWSLLFGGRFAFFIKDYIDRKFMRHFQKIE
jgi:NADH dehydrogenase FAD-containing subunit